MDWKYRRDDFKLPSAQLTHVDAKLAFFEDRVEGSAKLYLTAREKISQIILDANSLEIHSLAANLGDGTFEYKKDERKIVIPFKRELAAGEEIVIDCSVTSYPDDTHLEGIYRDVTPKGCPQQYMSQCQQFGFQRILPVIDDCTAKCTFHTELEGDARYTHLISNGNLISDETIGDRRRVVYENPLPMAPYLFIACAGTWDVLADEVTYPDSGKTIKLEYLVPPGHCDGAIIPMKILKESILFQHELTGYSYPYDTYRTICMEKSLYGGMENTGNTTIITEAALVDKTIGDRRMIYAYAVIPHEYEHNHCGSSVTMQTVFDMWLNEGYTVNVERVYLHKVFGSAFMRSKEINEMRRAGGPFAEEEAGTAGSVVREGVNDPDEVVDAVTYVKSPEVLNTLSNLIGKAAYRKATDLYFKRYEGSNANTDQFLECFEGVQKFDDGTALPKGGIKEVMHPWLFECGFPTVQASWTWEEGRLKLNASSSGKFTLPVKWAAVLNGCDICSGMFVLQENFKEIEIDCPQKPDYISWNRGASFYGVLVPNGVSTETLSLQVKSDPDGLNRIEAMRALYDHALAGNEKPWLDVFCEIFKTNDLPLNIKASLLCFPSEPVGRKLRGAVDRNAKRVRELSKIAAEAIGVDNIIEALEVYTKFSGDLPEMILTRAIKASLMEMLSEINSQEAWRTMEKHLASSDNMTDRLSSLTTIMRSDNPARKNILETYGDELRSSLNGYTGYLSIVASSPHEDVFDEIAKEESREGWSISHPGLSRALYCAAAANAEMIYTPSGLAWLERTIVKYAKVSEYNALRLLTAIEGYRNFETDLSLKCKSLLKRVAEELPYDKYAFIGGKLKSLLM
jgi:aminopeptidase N